MNDLFEKPKQGEQFKQAFEIEDLISKNENSKASV
jgi:hypothetical protein